MSLERFTRGSALRTALLLLLGAFTGALAFFAATAGVVLRESTSRHAGGAVNGALLDALDVTSYAVLAAAFSGRLTARFGSRFHVASPPRGAPSSVPATTGSR